MDRNHSKYDKKTTTAIIGLMFSPFFILIPGWLLFFKLQLLQAPELILMFPKAYTLLIALFISGIYFLIMGIIVLKKHKNTIEKNSE